MLHFMENVVPDECESLGFLRGKSNEVLLYSGCRHPITDLTVTLAEAKERLCEKIPQLACTSPTVVPATYLISSVNPRKIRPRGTWWRVYRVQPTQTVSKHTHLQTACVQQLKLDLKGHSVQINFLFMYIQSMQNFSLLQCFFL